MVHAIVHGRHAHTEGVKTYFLNMHQDLTDNVITNTS